MPSARSCCRAFRIEARRAAGLRGAGRPVGARPDRAKRASMCWNAPARAMQRLAAAVALLVTETSEARLSAHSGCGAGQRPAQAGPLLCRGDDDLAARCGGPHGLCDGETIDHRDRVSAPRWRARSKPCARRGTGWHGGGKSDVEAAERLGAVSGADFGRTALPRWADFLLTDKGEPRMKLADQEAGRRPARSARLPDRSAGPLSAPPTNAAAPPAPPRWRKPR